MRLYLSSYRMGDRAGSLLALLGGCRRAAIIENGHDHLPGEMRAHNLRSGYDPVSELASLGLISTRLDLRDYFGDATGLYETLAGFDLVWVAGGNSFVLRRAMKQSGFDDVITRMLDSDEIVYGGYSAGAVVAAPSLDGFDVMDDPDDVPPGYEATVVWEGLGLIDHAVVPHYRSPHPASAAADRTVKRLNGRGLRYRALRDGEVIVWTETRGSSIAVRRSA